MSSLLVSPCLKLNSFYVHPLNASSPLTLCVPGLPTGPVDLVINCLDSHEEPLLREHSWYQSATDWANHNRAPVLTIDPHMGEQTVEAKWTLSLGLPLPLVDGESRAYLCDIGIPRQVFQAVGINYHSPFGCKFIIPLHSAGKTL